MDVHKVPLYRKLVEEDLNRGQLLTERCSHSACFYPQAHAMYLFGGCTSRFAAFNDLWKFDLVSDVCFARTIHLI